MMILSGWSRWMVGFSLLGAVGCSDVGEADGTGGQTSSSGGSGQGGAPGSGGSGGAGAAGGQGGAGGAGGAAPCLPAADFAETFTLETDAFCVKEIVDAGALDMVPYVGPSPSFGSHGGPLTVTATPDEATVSRWVRDGATLSAIETTYPLVGLTEGIYFGPLGVETAPGGCEPIVSFGWTGDPFTTEGEFISLSAPVSQEVATGIFGLAAIGERVYYTGLSEVSGPTNNQLALYAVTPTCAGLEDPVQVTDGWGEAAGPLAADRDGNLFGVMTDFDGTQQIAALSSADLAETNPSVTPVGELAGFGDGLAAVAPEGDLPGWLVFQATNADTFAAEPPIAFSYTVEAGVIVPSADSTPFVTFKGGEDATFFIDDEGALWMAVSMPDASTRFFIFGRAD